MFKELLEDFEKLSLKLTGDQMEVYSSNVLDDLEKIALAKWKRNIRALSPESQDLLTKNIDSKKMGWKEIESHMKKINEASKINPVSRADRRRMHEANVSKKVLNYDSTVIDHEKELAGLNTGSYAIAKKFGVPMGHFDEKYLTDKYEEYLGSIGPNAPIRTRRNFKELVESGFREMGGALYGDGGGYNTLFHPTDKNARVINLGNKYPEQIRKAPYLIDSRQDLLAGKPKSLAQRYDDAISTRHEPDEVRSHIRMAKNVGKNYYSNEYSHLPFIRGKFHNHAHPDVIARESAHVAIAPKEVRDLRIRARAGEEIPGIEYGKSAVPELKKSRKYRKQLLEEFNRNNPNVPPFPLS